MKNKRIYRLFSIVLSLLLFVSILPLNPIKSEAASGVDDFVKRCYKVALQREPDKQGFNFWKGKVTNKELVGSSVVYNFIFSDEYTNQHKSDKEFVNDLYTMFMGRAADKEGYKFWCDKLSKGASRQDVFAGFANSEEFYKLCCDYGITAGYFTNEYDFQQVNNVNLFVERLYIICLNRIGDKSGQQYWVDGMLKGDLTGISCAANYIKSPEYISLKLTNEKYVENLYLAFMGRSFDVPGKAYWFGPLNEGLTSRDQVFEGFANSPEFKKICEGYGINPGSYTATDFTKSPKDPVKNPSDDKGDNGGSSDGGNNGGNSDNGGSNNGGTDNGGSDNGGTTGPGTDPGTDPGSNPGTDPGTDPGSNPGTDPGTDPGSNPGTSEDPANKIIEYTPRFEGDMGGYMNSKYPDKMPQVVIIYPSNPTIEEVSCSYVLQTYISAEDGYLPEIYTDEIPKGSKGFEISVGNTNRPHGSAKYSSQDSYSIKSYDNGISITGVGDIGLVSGSFRFLEACGGYFFLSWNDGYCTNQKQFQIDKTNGVNIDYERAFFYTDSDVCYQYSGNTEYRLYSMAFGYNGFMADSFCVDVGEPARSSWYLSTLPLNHNDGFYDGAHGGVPIGLVHTLLTEFIPEDQADIYFKTHPEWFCASDWEHKGATTGRTRTKDQLCLYQATHNEELYNIILNHCYDIINTSYDPNADTQIISISMSDISTNPCTCADCVKHRKSYGDSSQLKQSYELLELCNKLSADLHKDNKYQNLYIDTLAYSCNWTLNAPVGMKADDHVIVRFAPIQRCYGHYLDSPASDDYFNSVYYPELKKWCQISNHVWIWDYSINFRTSFAPYPNVDVMQHDIKLYKSLGIEGIYLQGNDIHLDSNAEFGDIRNFILGRMTQDPTRNYEEELAFYTDVYYGESGKYVREYMKHLEKQFANHQAGPEYADAVTNDCFRTLNSSYADSDGPNHSHRMSTAEINACEDLWNKIHALEVNATPEEQLRLKKLEFSWRVVKSTLKVKEFSNSTTYAKENAKLIKDLQDAGISKYGILGSKKMSSCTKTSSIPDYWQ